MAEFDSEVSSEKRTRLLEQRIRLLEKKTSHLFQHASIEETQLDIEFKNAEAEAERQSRARFISDQTEFLLVTGMVILGAACGGLIGFLIPLSAEGISASVMSGAIFLGLIAFAYRKRSSS